MSTPGIQSALSQMQALANQAQAGAIEGKGSQINTAVGQEGFADALYGAVNRINSLGQTAAAQTRAFQAGDPGVELHQVMMDGQKASVAFELGVQLRNRLVTAYKDVMNMQV
ncbi:flagellar hook-basal body complex protein FliE [Kineobactrum salinum]|uniref:Flagellar hook-basal body complex protein FliE n=1 Tax=Kineobactrum salinum TaxID=2708301 RepID=A0A6C0TWX0_9GAMM|nr:flagellar hook-basal body complex protein FliE [Kineobactrum salinum]QIB64320.1 flagellar hook-basal body complex protein FliE [Kineobactrum salinum]